MAYLAGTITDDSKIIVLNNTGTNVLTKQLYKEDSYTKLLLHFDSAPILDSSPRNQSLTLNGGVTITAPETQAMFGGFSGLFNGSTQYISIPDSEDWNFGSGDFTIDFWIRWASTPGGAFCGQSVGGGPNLKWGIYYNEIAAGNLTFHLHNPAGSATNVNWIWSPSSLIWYHLAVVRNGSIWTAYVNGNSLGSNNTSTAIANINTDLKIGTDGENWKYFGGNIDELRISKGIARWTANFTPPSAPYTSSGPVPYTQTLNDIDRYGYYINDITVLSGTVLSMHPTTGETTGYIQTNFVSDISSDYTKLLLHFNESPLIDTMGKTLTLNGGIARSATQSKFGGYAGYFNGGYISVTDSLDWEFEGQDFTIDFWLNTSSITNQVILGVANTTPATNGWRIGADTVEFFIQSFKTAGDPNGIYLGISKSNVEGGSFKHIAFVRNGSRLDLYINGISVANLTKNTEWANPSNPLQIGRWQPGNILSNSYIDELRISKGIARWKHNFVPPTLAYTV